METPKIIKLRNIINQEAGLVIAQNDENLPFDIKRVYWFYNVPEGQVRGHHAHKVNKKMLICKEGEVVISLENTKGEIFNFILNKPHEGLFVPPLHWGTFEFKQGASMLCLASELFNEQDYIRDFEEFRRYNKN